MKAGDLTVKERLKILIVAKYLSGATFVNIGGNLFLSFDNKKVTNQESLFSLDIDEEFIVGTHPIKEDIVSYTARDLLNSTRDEKFIYIKGQSVIPFIETVTECLLDLDKIGDDNERT